MFKKIFFILSLMACCFEFAALAQLVPQTSRSVSSPQPDNVNTAQSIVFVIGNDGKLHQIAVDSNGGQFMLLTGTVTTSPAAGSIYVMSMSNTASTPFYISFTPGAILNPWSTQPSYGAATVAAFDPPNAIGDRWGLENRGTTLVYVTYLDFTSRASTSATRTIQLAKRSSYDTGGTAVTISNTAMDSTFAASNVLVKQFTTQPADGTFVGNIWSAQYDDMQITSGNGQSQIRQYNFVENGESPIVVRPGESIYLHDMNGTNDAAEWTVSVKWAEQRPNP